MVGVVEFFFPDLFDDDSLPGSRQPSRRSSVLMVPPIPLVNLGVVNVSTKSLTLFILLLSLTAFYKRR